MDDGSLFTEGKMREKGLKINFLDYAKLKHSVKNLEIKKDKYNKKIGPRLPKILFDIGLTTKG